MKILALILSVYVIALTAMPCSDDGVVDNKSLNIEVVQQSQTHSEDIDLCSPFCFCNCCQTLAQPSLYSISQIAVLTDKLTLPSMVQNEKEGIISFWRPPKYI